MVYSTIDKGDQFWTAQSKEEQFSTAQWLKESTAIQQNG